MATTALLQQLPQWLGNKTRSARAAIQLWNGQRIGSRDARVTVTLRQPSAFKIFLRPSAGKLAQAYVEERIDIDGALRDVIGFANDIGGAGIKARPWDFLIRRRRHNRRSDRRAIQHHYDVSNDFYALWLDRNRVYSCAYFRSESDSLDQAQQQKLDHICRKLNLQAGERMLDIGCGWGGLMFQAAQHYGARCLGITLSRQQHDYVAAQIRERGLERQCEVRLMDYRDLPAEAQFDKISSVGMFEHVGRKRLGEYFRVIHDHLAPGGLLLNHGIAAAWTQGRGLGSDVSEFIDHYVFPDGELVHLSETLAALARCDFETRDVESLRPHYARTLWHWVARLDRHAAEARRIVGEKVYRVWRVYMAGSAMSFERGWISIYQVLAARPREDGGVDYPLTREHLYRN